jgi:hypothetical protein
MRILALLLAGCTGVPHLPGNLLATTRMPEAVAVDDVNVYWLEITGSIFSVPKAGGAPSEIATSVLVPQSTIGFGGGCSYADLAVRAGSLFAICEGLVQVSLDGTVDVIDPQAVAFALDADNVYWASMGSGLYSRPIAGGPSKMLLNWETGAMAAAAGQLYWATLWSMPAGGGTPSPLVDEDPDTEGAVRLVVGGGYLYYSTQANDIRRVPLTGGTVSIVAQTDGYGAIVPIAGTYRASRELNTDGSFLYWHGHDHDSYDVLKRMPLAGGDTTLVAADGVEITAWASDGKRLFYGTDAVYRQTVEYNGDSGPYQAWAADTSNGGGLFSIAL